MAHFASAVAVTDTSFPVLAGFSVKPDAKRYPLESFQRSRQILLGNASDLPAAEFELTRRLIGLCRVAVTFHDLKDAKDFWINVATLWGSLGLGHMSDQEAENIISFYNHSRRHGLSLGSQVAKAPEGSQGKLVNRLFDLWEVVRPKQFTLPPGEKQNEAWTKAKQFWRDLQSASDGYAMIFNYMPAQQNKLCLRHSQLLEPVSKSVMSNPLLQKKRRESEPVDQNKSAKKTRGSQGAETQDATSSVTSQTNGKNEIQHQNREQSKLSIKPVPPSSIIESAPPLPQTLGDLPYRAQSEEVASISQVNVAQPQHENTQTPLPTVQSSSSAAGAHLTEAAGTSAAPSNPLASPKNQAAHSFSRATSQPNSANKQPAPSSSHIFNPFASANNQSGQSSSIFTRAYENAQASQSSNTVRLSSFHENLGQIQGPSIFDADHRLLQEARVRAVEDRMARIEAGQVNVQSWLNTIRTREDEVVDQLNQLWEALRGDGNKL